MTDIPPANRKRGRPVGSKTKHHHQPAVPGSLAAQRQRASLAKPPQSPPNFIGVVSAEADSEPDELPAPEGYTEQQETASFAGFRGPHGLIKTNIVSTYAFVGMSMGGPNSKDGRLFLENAVPIADSWIAWGKADPRYMKVVKIIWGGPFTTLLIGHAALVGGLMANHGISAGKLLAPVNVASMMRSRQQGPKLSNFAANYSYPTEPAPEEPAPMPYQPVGPSAPTEDVGPPEPVVEEGLRLYPDEGIPSDLDVVAREIARRTGRPYAEVLVAVQQEWANLEQKQRMKFTTTPPNGQGLGTPVTRE